MSEIRVFENSLFGMVRAVELEGLPYAVGVDVARALGYAKPSQAVIDHCKGIRKLGIPSGGGMQETNIIPEGDIYRLIIRSALPAAERFERWVMEEVLPDIRRRGLYATGAAIDRMLQDPDAMIALLTEYKQEKAKRRALEAMAAENAPKVLFADTVEASDTSILIGELAKYMRQRGVEIGQNRLFERMRRDGYLISRGESRNIPSQYAVENGWMEIKQRTVINPDGSNRITRTPMVTGKGQVFFINKYSKAAV